jgi:hypothetical protein
VHEIMSAMGHKRTCIRAYVSGGTNLQVLASVPPRVSLFFGIGYAFERIFV